MANKTTNYLGALWLACELLSRSNPTQKNVESWFDSITQSASEEDRAKAVKYTRKIYRRKYREQIRSYQKAYREKEKLKVLRGE